MECVAYECGWRDIHTYRRTDRPTMLNVVTLFMRSCARVMDGLIDGWVNWTD